MVLGVICRVKARVLAADAHSAVGGGVPNAPQGTADKSLSSS